MLRPTSNPQKKATCAADFKKEQLIVLMATMAFIVLATCFRIRSKRYNVKERSTFKRKPVDEEKAKLTSWRSRENFQEYDEPLYVCHRNTTNIFPLPDGIIGHGDQSSLKNQSSGSNGCESELSSNSEDMRELGLTSKISSSTNYWFDMLEQSSSLESLVRTGSIQDKALKITRKRHQKLVKRKKGNSSQSTDTDDDQAQHKRKQINNGHENEYGHVKSSGSTTTSNVETCGQTDSPNDLHSESQCRKLVRTNSMQMKSWEIRRRRKAMVLKRKALSFDDVLLQDVERSV